MPAPGYPDTDQGTKQKDFLKLVKDMKQMPTDNFNAPFSSTSLHHFDQIIEQEFQKIGDQIKTYVIEARQLGSKFKKNIEEFPTFIQFRLDLEFLHE